MCVKSPSADFITTRFWYESLFESSKHGTGSHNRPAKSSAFFLQTGAVKKVYVDVISLEAAGVAGTAINFNAHISQ